ncbi:putative sporulation protein (polysaccharide deacetylase family) [Paenibacillus endophyticus]|uniref:Putative sporulation protein (Polysaccharide deacetylase family) n=1 Tax=Paenibacillus endophyticus TaxID=1294268 RepID=A0A7W5C6H0_9BACL|nr:polysaccharide deacetylase family protein [Paenibacillus endophyticus]MBB3152058.1 putative sporulation protein (polysaccharide deacetylase family) [Paenibacillus endophyticus]
MMVRKAAMIVSSMLLVLALVSMNEDVSRYLATIKYKDNVTATTNIYIGTKERDRLLAVIQTEADKLKVSPVNARIDRVWRAIPGYNGLEVDVEKTLEAALLALPAETIQYVFKEVEPQIKLNDLGPHPIYRGNSNKRMISLMINVAWGNEFMDAILNTLKSENVKATFFLDGSWLYKNVELASRIQSEGHEMSNHAYTHPDMKALDRQSQYNQIAKTEALLKTKLHVNNKWFAPPSGSFNQTTVQIAEEMGLKTVLWTIDTIDWQKPPADSVIRKISAKLEPGALILMHPTATTRDALQGIIAAAKAKGYAIGTVSETLSSKRLPAAVEGAD